MSASFVLGKYRNLPDYYNSEKYVYHLYGLEVATLVPRHLSQTSSRPA